MIITLVNGRAGSGGFYNVFINYYHVLSTENGVTFFEL